MFYAKSLFEKVYRVIFEKKVKNFFIKNAFDAMIKFQNNLSSLPSIGSYFKIYPKNIWFTREVYYNLAFTRNCA
jgi:hypothetical protein